MIDPGIPLTQEGEGCSLDPPDLAPGVRGYAIQAEDGAIYVPFIIAAREGAGDVGRFLDGLYPQLTWKFPTVLSNRLAGMLLRRGFSRSMETHEGEDVEVWVKEPIPEALR